MSRLAPPPARPAAGVQALAMFLGPDAYISPGWYATKRETGKVVPTWNYVAIHAYGEVRFFEDAERLLALVTRLTETHKGGRPEPWAVSDAPAEFIRGQLRGIVGPRVRPSAGPRTASSCRSIRLEGKWRMSQNRPAEDRAGAIEGLRREGGPAEAAVAEIMAGMERT